VNIRSTYDFAAANLELAVSVDRLAPEQGAFAFALEWARHLRCDLRLLVSDPADAERANGCTAICRREGCGGEPCSVDQLACAAASESSPVRRLIVIGHALAATMASPLLRQARDGVMICPDRWQPVTRALVVHRDAAPGSAALLEGVRLCRAIEAKPIVLTVARSKRQALRQREEAQKVLNQQGLAADCDYLVAADIGMEVIRVAHWRRCSLVVFPPPARRPWWRWLRDGTMDRLWTLTDDLAVLQLAGWAPLRPGLDPWQAAMTGERLSQLPIPAVDVKKNGNGNGNMFAGNG
jgi:hypothetical protein